jgi:glycosyltransferase involved in cell wall biosynthesis
MKKKEIWLEATQLLKSPAGHKSGIGYFTENLIKNLLNTYKEYDYKIVGNIFVNKIKPKVVAGKKGHDLLLTRYIPSKIWNKAVIMGILPNIDLLYKGSPDLVINFDFARVPVSRNIKTITVIHDLAYVVFPGYTEKKNLSNLRKVVPNSIKKSTRIVAVSESTKKDLIELFSLGSEKIDVVYNAVDQNKFYPTKLSDKVKIKYGIPEKYFLYLGNIEPRKNIKGIIEAYTGLPDKITNEYKLVLAGGRGWNQDEINNALNRSTKKDNIIFTGYIDDADKPEIYSGSDIFLFPSHYEGFGLPILEAMACEVPVITAKNSSLKEVAGNAALYVDSKRPKELTEAIIKIVENKNIRNDLVKKGTLRAKEFSWKKSAAQMNESIKKAIKL